MESESADGLSLGQRIRQLRFERGVIAADLAARAGVSASFLSQIERGAATPSLKVLQQLARELGVAVGSLVDTAASPRRAEPTTSAEIVRCQDRKVLRRASGPEYQLLSPDLRGQIEFIWVQTAGGEASLLSTHEGEEQIVVLSGSLIVEVAGEEFELHAGDAARFDPCQPHRTMNRSDAPTTYVSAITPPSF